MKDHTIYGLVFAAVSAGALWRCVVPGDLWGLLAAGPIAVAFGVVAEAYLFRRPDWLGKLPDGRTPLWIWVFLWPYFTLNHFSLWIYRRMGEAPLHQVAPGVYLGCRLSPGDSLAVAAFRPRAVLDLTSEFAEVPFMRSMGEYRCIPLLDATAPTPEELREGIEWLRDCAARGLEPVYIHCAAGHGRSATYAAAWLMDRTPGLELEAVLQQLTAIRPGVKLTAAQKAVLREFTPRNK